MRSSWCGLGEESDSGVIQATVKHCPDDCNFESWTDTVSRCRECGLGKTVLPVTDASEQDYQGRPQAEQVVKRRYFKAIYRRNLRELPTGAILDVGCADGLFLDVMRAQGWTAQGIEAFAGEGSIRNDMLTGEFLTLDVPRRYDVIAFVHSFEHMPDPGQTLRKCCAILNPSGRLLLVVPNFGGWWSRLLGDGWPWLNTSDHCYHYTRDAFCHLLTQNGFQPVSIRTYSRFTPSMVEMYLTARGVFEHPLARWWPLRSVLYRLSSGLRAPVNWLVDRAGQGAELQVVAVMQDSR